MMVSIIIPCFNAEKTIERALVSVAGQTHGELEIIIIDDGSIDATQHIVETFFQSHPALLYRYMYQQNGGPAKARNEGMSIAQGEYIAFLDSDDAWHPQKLEIQITTMQKTKTYISGTLHKIIDGIKLIEEEEKRFNLHDVFLKNISWPKILFLSPFATPSVIMHKSLKEYVFNENILFSEDYNLWKRITYKNSSKKIMLPLTYTFKHDYISESISLSTNLAKMQKGINQSFFNLLYSSEIKFIDKLWIFPALLFSQIKYLRRVTKYIRLRKKI